MDVDESDIADDLALRALSTPAVGAPDALEVLLDVLLEAGIIPADVPRPTGHQIGSSDEPALHLRRRAYHWAKQRLSPLPSPTERLVGIVVSALEEASLPLPVLGVVGPFILRLHYVMPVDPGVLVLVHGAVSRHLPSSLVVEVTNRSE